MIRIQSRLPRYLIAGALLLLASRNPVAGAVKKMFVTSATGNGNFGSWPEAGTETGAAGANQICRTLAGNAGLANANTFRAWISTPATDAYCRIAGFSGQRDDNCGQPSLPDAGPWERIDGRPFARSLLSLTSNFPFVPATVDEAGAFVPPSANFSATSPDGRLTGDHCDGWTDPSGAIATYGGASYWGGPWWAWGASRGCDDSSRLICFEPGAGDPLPDIELPGAYAFISSANGTGNLGSWPEAGGFAGLAAGDAICQNLAAAAGLPQPSTFVAWLSTGSVDARDRLPAATPFKRVDGIRIALNKSELTTADPGDLTLRAALNLTEAGEYWGNSARTGTLSTGIGSGAHCSGWTSAAAVSVDSGTPNDIRGEWTERADGADCESEYLSIYCFSTVVTIFRDSFELGNASRWSNY